MSLTKKRGTQLRDKTLTSQQIADDAAIKLTSLLEGAELLKRDGSVASTADFNAGGFKVVHVADGVADTDAVNKRQLDSAIASVQQAMSYGGDWDATTALPTDIKNGQTFVVTVAGTFDGKAIQVGAELIANVTKSAGVTAADFDVVNREDQVLTVAGKKGVVTLVAADITDLTVTSTEINQLDGIASNVQDQLDAKLDDSQLVTDGTFSSADDLTVASSKAVKTYVDAVDAAAKVYTDSQDAATLASAKAYTAAEDAILKAYVDTQDLAATATAKAYTDARETAVRTDFAAADTAAALAAKNYTDARETAVRSDMATEDAATLAAAKTYSDAQDVVMKTYVDAQDAATLTTAKGYTDTTDAARKSYIDSALQTLSQYVDAADVADKAYSDTTSAAALASAKVYADGLDAARKTATDTQDAAQKTYIDTEVAAAKDYADTKDAALKAYVDTQDTAIKALITSSVSGGLPVFVYEETPVGLIDGINDTFTLSQDPVVGSVQTYCAGDRWRNGATNDFVVTGKVIKCYNIPQPGDQFFCDYRTN